jgi:hypothetical protein
MGGKLATRDQGADVGYRAPSRPLSHERDSGTARAACERQESRTPRCRRLLARWCVGAGGRTTQQCRPEVAGLQEIRFGKAEGVGFEPTVPVDPGQRFSRLLQSVTLTGPRVSRTQTRH